MDQIKELKRLLRQSRQKAYRSKIEADDYRPKMFVAQGRANRLHEALRPFAEAVISSEEHKGVLKSEAGRMLISAEHFQHMMKHPLIYARLEAVRRIYPNWQAERLAK